MIIKIQDGTGSQRLAEVDDEYRLRVRAVIVDHAHHELHEGNSYVVTKAQITSNADTKVTILTFKTATTGMVNMFPSASATGAAWFYVYEAPTVVNNTGTATVTVYNRNRQSNKISSVIDTKSNPNVHGSVTYWDESDGAGANITLGDGEQIYGEQIAAGRTTYAQTRSEAEFVLKRDTLYAFVLENEGSTANLHNIILNFYED